MWFVMYLGATGVGLTAIPILPEFSPDDIRNIIAVSRAKMIVVGEKQFEKVKPMLCGDMRLVRLEDLFEIPGRFFPRWKARRILNRPRATTLPDTRKSRTRRSGGK